MSNPILKTRNATLGEFDKVNVQQLDYCNAFERYCYIDDVLVRIELVSYCTPVVALELDVHQHVYSIECAPAAICSATTRKHVGRFLNEHTTDVTYAKVKQALATVPKCNFANGLRVIVEGSGDVYGLHDVHRLFDVRYESIKPFE